MTDSPGRTPLAVILDGGHGRRLEASALRRWSPDDGPLWIRLREPEDRSWLETESGLGVSARETFLRHSAWPTVQVQREGCLLLLMRAPSSAAPSHGFVVLRLLVEPSRIITLAPAGVEVISEMERRMEKGVGPDSVNQFLIEVMELLGGRIADSVLDLWTAVTELELMTVRERKSSARSIQSLRSRALELQRIADPLRVQLLRLRGLELNWLLQQHETEWRAVSHNFEDATFELDAIGEHLRVLEDTRANRTAEQMNRRIYLLAVVSTTLLPPSLIASIMGMNIGVRGGSVAGASHPGWFIGLCLGLVLVSVLTFVILHRRGLF